jgi:MarR family transcriptional regulator, lower aerobic nicotinate degradation pathway regulator
MTAIPAAATIASRPRARVAQELAESSGFLLARLGMDVKAKAIARVEQAGYELYDYSVLAILAEGDRETQSAIADALGLDPSRLVALLDSLEKRGLVIRQRDPNDRRRYVISITADGKRVHADLRELTREVEAQFFAPLDPESRKLFHALLMQLVAHHDPRCAPELDVDAPSLA